MERENKQIKKVCQSMKEFEEKFFPHSYEEKLAEKKAEDPVTFGVGLATELLKSIQQQLIK